MAETSSEEEEEKEVQQDQEKLEASVERTCHDVEGTAVAVAVPTVSVEQAERLQGSDIAIAGLQQAIQVLKDCGAVSALHPLEVELKKELKRQRLAAQEDTAVAAALVGVKAAKDAAEREHALAVKSATREEQALANLRKEKETTQALLREKKRELMSIEQVLETKHALKRFSPEALGQGKARSGGAASRKLRYEVLDRMARLGTGLSPAQRNDWVWFREAWDAKMSGDHKENWGQTFCGWMQKILNAVADGQANAFFSLFMMEVHHG